MVALTADVALQLLGERYSTGVETHRALLVSLRRWRAEEEIGDELYDDLNAVLDPYPSTRLAVDEAGRIAERLRGAVATVLGATPYLTAEYPVEAVRRMVDLRAQWPYPGDIHSYVVRLALAVLSVLDVMGEATP